MPKDSINCRQYALLPHLYHIHFYGLNLTPNYHSSITHTSILPPLCIKNTMANLSFYLLFLTLIGASSLPFLQPMPALVDCESEVVTGEEEFKAWLDYMRWSEQNQPHFQQLFHRSENTSTLVVDLDGNGNFTSIQKAVDSIPLGNKSPVYIVVNPGVYREKLEIPRGKDFITLQGHGRSSTVVVWNDTAAGVNSTFRSASIAVDAQYFAAMDITFQNSAPAQEPGAERKQAVAMRVSGDNAVFHRCGFLGHQDTLYDQKGEHYFRDCYIEGSIDFVFGNGRSLYQGCELHVVPITPGSLTAQKRAKNDSDSGFVFLKCSITGSGVVYLGRAWGRYSRVVFLYTYMGDIIMPQGWNNWGDTRRNGTVYYGQYMCTGPGAKPYGREPWAHQLTNEEAKPFLTLDFIQGSTWVPLVMPSLTI